MVAQNCGDGLPQYLEGLTADLENRRGMFSKFMRMSDADLSDNSEFTRFLVTTTDELLMRVEELTGLAQLITGTGLRGPDLTARECGLRQNKVNGSGN
jgi:hypothetical protein